MIEAQARLISESEGLCLVRSDYEDFLFHEAALLDEWRLDEWLALFAEGATYDVPMAGAPDDADSSEELFYVSDDYARLQHRVRRLNKPGAHSEWPRSKIVHAISNVRILERRGSEALIGSVFVTYRSKNDLTDTYFGHHRHLLRHDGAALRIVSKRSMLDMSSLRPQGRVSIIL
jgi:p-cumate 2,3-dioxygenase beta subunit